MAEIVKKLKGKVITCETCGKEFYVSQSGLRYRNPRFCSRKCMPKPRFVLPDGRELKDLQ